ncbi:MULTISPECIES: hypothetical protein [Streptomyces]|jgi:hypothetical protein|nr:MULTISPECIES: hypothetical protein [Streptomyces]MCX4437666.1 hypothetical protein [Streptomyces mirabilis]
MPRICSECGTEAVPLLTIATTEWGSGGEGWIPEEEQANPTPMLPGRPPANFTRIVVASGYNLRLHVCPASPDQLDTRGRFLRHVPGGAERGSEDEDRGVFRAVEPVLEGRGLRPVVPDRDAV